VVPEGQIIDKTIALKDLDFIAEKRKLQVGRDNKDKLMNIIEKDSMFFAKCGIIDYSLLVGVHELSKHQTCKQDSASEISIHQSDIENTPQMSGRHSKPHEHQIRKKFYE
jgi:hypothetical protein